AAAGDSVPKATDATASDRAPSNTSRRVTPPVLALDICSLLAFLVGLSRCSGPASSPESGPFFLAPLAARAAHSMHAAGIRSVLPRGARPRGARGALDVPRDPRAPGRSTAIQRDPPRRAASLGDAPQAAAAE